MRANHLSENNASRMWQKEEVDQCGVSKNSRFFVWHDSESLKDARAT